MNVPLRWLQDYVAFEAEPAALAERLTFAGLEVEAIATVGSDFAGVVVGEILEVRPHPKADRLTLCDVATGRGTVRVVCGAPGVRPGDKAPFAGPGTVLPGGLQIQAMTLRGEPSHGMLCAEDELGLSDDHATLMRLPPELPAGTPLAEVVGGPETVLTIAVTPNRPDWLSLIGIAREVAALYGSRLTLPEVRLAEAGAAVGAAVRVAVEDPAGCPRYTARLLRGVTIGPSPLAMRLRLARAGVRPINAVVDITNYVMLECGQPLHAFDLARLAEGRLVVRRARPGETLATLDGAPRALTPAMLVIADARAPVAVAGVMGGAASGIGPETRDVVLESACFQPTLIRRTSKALGLASESSYRFERGVDVLGAEWASRRAAALMAVHAGGSPAPGVLDVVAAPPPERVVACRYARVRDLLGVAIADAAVAGVFEALALPVVERRPDGCAVRIPTFRPDLEAEVDLIEEVARLHGLDKIPAAPPAARLGMGVDDRPIRAALACREALAGLGLVEIMNYSLVSERLLGLCAPGPTPWRLAVPRPISADQAVLRDALLPQMLETLGRNRARQVDQAALFEIGRVFFRTDAGAPVEEERLAVGLMGPVGRSGPAMPSLGVEGGDPRRDPSDMEVYLWIKGLIEALCRRLGFRIGDRPAAAGAPAGLALAPFDPAVCGLPPAAAGAAGALADDRRLLVLLDGAPCGVLGLVREALRREWRLTSPVALLELRLAPLLARSAAVPAAVRPPVFPAVVRDLALRVPRAARHGDLAAAIWGAAPRELTALRLFDRFEASEIGPASKSLAYSLTYRAEDRTLTDEEVNRLHETLKDRLRGALGVEIRDGA